MISELFDAVDFMPHGYCFLWQPALIWGHVVGDLLIALAYFAISLTLGYIWKKYLFHTPFKWVLMMFAVFILCCGITHILSIITLWYPIYVLQGLMKIITAAVSLATAMMVIPIVPLALLKLHENGHSDS